MKVLLTSQIYKGPVLDNSIASVLVQTPPTLLTPFLGSDSGSGLIIESPVLVLVSSPHMEQELGAALLFGVLQDSMFS